MWCYEPNKYILKEFVHKERLMSYQDEEFEEWLMEKNACHKAMDKARDVDEIFITSKVVT